MRQSNLAGIILASLLITPAFAEYDHKQLLNITPLVQQGGFEFGLSGLYWRPSPLSDYALSSTALAFVPPSLAVGNSTQGEYHNTANNYQWGYQISAGYWYPNTAMDIRLTYTNYEQNTRDHTVAGDSNLLSSYDSTLPVSSTPITIVDFVTIPDFILREFEPPLPITLVPSITYPLAVNLITVREKLEYQSVNAEIGQHLNIGDHLHLRLLGGLSYTNLKNSVGSKIESRGFFATPTTLAVVGIEASPIGAPISREVIVVTASASGITTQEQSIDAYSKFNGVGPKFGFEANYAIGNTGLGVVGKLSTSLLVGETTSSFNERIITNTSSETSVNETIVLGVALGNLVYTGLGGEVITDTIISFKHPDETRIAANVEAKIGLDYGFRFSNSIEYRRGLFSQSLLEHPRSVVGSRPCVKDSRNN